MVSDTRTDGRCNYEYDDGGYCEAHPMDNGRCFHHGGQAENGGAPAQNANASTHDLYAEPNTYYQRRDERGQQLIDDIYRDYRDEYIRQHGREPLAGEKVKLLDVAVGIHKTAIRADDWVEQRPDSTDSGHPLVDRSEKRTAQGEPYYEYKPSAVLRAEKSVSNDVRLWLKDLGLMPSRSDDTTVTVNVHDEILAGMKAAHDTS